MKKIIAYSVNTEELSNKLELIEPAEDNVTDERLVEIANEIIPNTTYSIILKSDVESLPLTPITRRTLTFIDGQISIDLLRLKSLVKDNIRDYRIDLLRDLDVQYLIALEKSRDVTEVTNEKNRLRHLPAYIDSLNTVDEILNVTVNTTYDWQQFEV